MLFPACTELEAGKHPTQASITAHRSPFLYLFVKRFVREKYYHWMHCTQVNFSNLEFDILAVTIQFFWDIMRPYWDERVGLARKS